MDTRQGVKIGRPQGGGHGPLRSGRDEMGVASVCVCADAEPRPWLHCAREGFDLLIVRSKFAVSIQGRCCTTIAKFNIGARDSRGSLRRPF